MLSESCYGVVGGAGILGTRLVIKLVERGAGQVVVFDQPQAIAGSRLREVPGVVCQAGNLLEPSDLERALAPCTVVYHLAALTHVGRSLEDPQRYWDINSGGTVRVLEACRRLGVRQIIYASTGAVYGQPCASPITEQHPTRPLSIYAASKLAGEAALQGYAASFKLAAVIARLANIYGAPWGADTVIGRALEQVATRQPVRLRNLSAVRDFVYIDDVVEALIRLCLPETTVPCCIVNVASARGVSIGEVAQTLVAVAERQGLGHMEILPSNEPGQESIPVLVMDNHYLKALTAWTPQITLEQGLSLALQERLALKS
jgi:UDP-glucose 4-epimerase